MFTCNFFGWWPQHTEWDWNSILCPLSEVDVGCLKKALKISTFTDVWKGKNFLLEVVGFFLYQIRGEIIQIMERWCLVVLDLRVQTALYKKIISVTAQVVDTLCWSPVYLMVDPVLDYMELSELLSEMQNDGLKHITSVFPCCCCLSKFKYSKIISFRSSYNQ